MPEFTREDRNLLVRVGKFLRTEVETAERLAGEGSGVEAAKAHRSLRDRLLRDERDLEGLRKRLEAAHPQALQAAGKVAPAE